MLFLGWKLLTLTPKVTSQVQVFAKGQETSGGPATQSWVILPKRTQQIGALKGHARSDLSAAFPGLYSQQLSQ